MTTKEFEEQLDEHLKRDGFTRGDVEGVTYKECGSGTSYNALRINGERCCSFTLHSGYGEVRDVVWARDRLGEPCLAFKGINKFLRKREVAP